MASTDQEPQNLEDGGHTNEAFEDDDQKMTNLDEKGDDGRNSKQEKKLKKKKKKQDGKESDKEEEPALPPVPLFSLFRFASKNDVIAIVIGVLAAIGSSLGFPVMLVLFGDVTNSFVGGGISPEELEKIRCNASYANHSHDSNNTDVSVDLFF